MREQKDSLRFMVRQSAVVKNPVLFEAIGLAPVVAMAVSLKSAIMLAAVSCAELVLIELFACLVLKRVKSYFRMPIYAVLGMLINVPIFVFFEHFAPNETNSAGIFLPLLAVNSLIALHCERFAVKNTFRNTFIDALAASAGYAFVVLIIGAVRELLGSGTIYSVDLHFPVRLSGFLLPFGGFLLLGFFAAALKALIHKKYPKEEPETAFNLREISQSHLGSLKALMDAEFDPYEEGAAEIPQEIERAEEKKVRKPKKAKPKKTEKTAKTAKAPAAPEAASAKPEPTQAPERSEEVKPHRTAREDYLLDFDEILTELDEYRQKQSETPTTDETQRLASDPAASASAQETSDNRTREGDDA